MNLQFMREGLASRLASGEQMLCIASALFLASHTLYIYGSHEWSGRPALCFCRGCVIFNGDNELKTLLQWIALSAVGRTMHYKAFGDSQLESMEETLLAIRSRFPTTKDLFGAIVECIQQREESPGDEWSLWQSLLKLETKKPQ